MTDLPDGMDEFLKSCSIDPSALMHGKGCEKCRGTGYRGRLGVYEFLRIDNEIRRIISKGPTLNELPTRRKQPACERSARTGWRRSARG